MTGLDLDRPIGPGRTLLEASAGTGKTWSLAALAVREIAHGRVGMSQLLVVTFTVPAAAELRGRIRARLVAAAAELAGTPTADPDPALAAVHGDAAEVRRAQARVAAAVTAFETATITTLDGFAHRALGLLGALAAHDDGAELVADDSELVDAVLRNALVAARAADPRRELPDLTRARACVLELLADPHARPAEQPPHVADLLRAVVERVTARRRALRRTTYADVLHRLHATVHDRDAADAARHVLQRQYRVVMLDESQDTSPLQWAILDAAFRRTVPGVRPPSMVVVGDPKQSIYAFRGADVDNHLRARADAEDQRTLAVNWRSDRAVLDGMQRLWQDASFGGADIAFERVAPRPAAPRTALSDGRAAVEVRLADGWAEGRKQWPPAEADRAVRADLTREVRRLLDGATTIADAGQPPRPVRPSDIAVLVRTNRQARAVLTSLRDAGVDAMVDGVGSVLQTDAADWWRALLQALVAPGDDLAARWFATTPLYGLSPAELAADDPALAPGLRDPRAVDELHDRLHRWAIVLRDHGVAALLRRVVDERDVPQRLLLRPRGRRELVDVLHVADLLHDAQRSSRLGAGGLLDWLDAATGATEKDVGVDRREQMERRLETEDDAVRISTVHRAKGREYPIVLLPFAGEHGNVQVPVVTERRDDGVVVHHDGADAAHKAARATCQQRVRDEWWRLLYVAMTRARHRVVAWWLPRTNWARAPLSLLLFDTTAAGRPALAAGADPLRALRDPLQDHDDAFAAASFPVPSREGPTSVASPAARTPRAAAHTTWSADRTWRRTSYSGLVRLLDDGHAHARTTPHHDAAEALVRVLADDDSSTADVQPTPRSSSTPAMPLAAVVGGRELGTLAHEALELVDFASPTLVDDLHGVVSHLLTRRPVAVDATVLASGLAAAVDTPLGPIADGRALRSVERRDRLDELPIDLPLAGGWRATGALDLDAIRDVLHLHSGDDPLLERYAARLRDARGTRVAVAGYLTGAVDLVARLRGPGPGPDRYLVVDHKSNRLAAGAEPTLDDYHPDALAATMVTSDYVLQALLYAVAVHRFLRWRLGDEHDLARDLAGVAWTFLRGMVGPTTPRTDDGRVHGVFTWTPPPALVADLDELLHRGQAA